MLDAMKAKADKTYSFFRKILGLLMAWGLVFSVVTIGEMRVGFDYDDTLVFSTPAFKKAFDAGVQAFSPEFWKIVNSNYDLEQPKVEMNAIAWALRLLGFKIAILTARPNYGGEGLQKEWRHLSKDFIFANGAESKHTYLKDGNYVLYFGDSDTDITEGRKARVLTLRVKRSPKSTYKEDYNPGSLREPIIPFSEY
ncbi:MAG TPA: hypothetical protein VNI01_14635 [Elusimicrobiota bacterium]|jgi:acid phosphatase class B|nr:hypothetical protein [Elusimicrobiota bacterium]